MADIFEQLELFSLLLHFHVNDSCVLRCSKYAHVIKRDLKLAVNTSCLNHLLDLWLDCFHHISCFLNHALVFQRHHQDGEVKYLRPHEYPVDNGLIVVISVVENAISPGLIACFEILRMHHWQ